MPENWPDVTLALALAAAGAYLVADVVARAAQALLRTVIADPQTESVFVDRPRRVIRLVVFLVTAAALAVPALRIAGYDMRVGADPEALARWALDRGVRIVFIAIAAYLIVRIGSAAARRLEREMSAGIGLDVLERTKRAQTLGRLIQKALSAVVLVIAGLMILRELDMDITPVLATAGVAGVALGFGAQTLVRDIISGFFLIVEDQVRVGDVAVVNGQGGLVEAINLRTIVLRDLDGTVHVFPNGEIKTLANRTKDYSYYVVDIGVAYGDDPDRVADALREVAGGLADDPAFRPHILAPIEILGVEAFGDSQVTLRARIKTVPLKQWDVGRELRRRIAREFPKRGIALPVPQRRVWIRSEGGSEGAGRSGGAPPEAPNVQQGSRRS